MEPRLIIIVPCYNEEQVLSITSKMFEEELLDLIQKKKIHKDSRILFVNDGSTDSTWEIIKNWQLLQYIWKASAKVGIVDTRMQFWQDFWRQWKNLILPFL